MDKKQGPQLIQDTRGGNLNLDDLVDNPNLEGFHIAAILGTVYGLMTDDDCSAFRSSVVKRTGYEGFLRSPSDMGSSVGSMLREKRDGNEWTGRSVADLVHKYVANQITNEEMAAVLAMIMVKGMATSEIVSLTRAMTDSGDRLDFSELTEQGYVAVDKHSTGGISDGVSLVLAPLVAAAYPQIIVPMMSGRGLGHTGGTLDKLESIPGFRVDLSEDEIRAAMLETRVAIFAPMPSIVPADGKMYALRDLTNCVSDSGLIVGSILSKKIAEGTKVLVMDTKTGNGAFKSKFEDAKLFAQLMCNVGRGNGLNVNGFITDMNQPLGMYAGNKLEVLEALEYLRGLHQDSDFMKVVYTLAEKMVELAGFAEENTRVRLHETITSGAAYDTFLKMVRQQHGDLASVRKLARLLHPTSILTLAQAGEYERINQVLSPEDKLYFTEIRAERDGMVSGFQLTSIGEEIRALGAGRYKQGDSVNPYVGLITAARLGQPVRKGELIAVVVNDGKKGSPEKIREYIHVSENYDLGTKPRLIKELVKPTAG